jgi:hypothetical protein
MEVGGQFCAPAALLPPGKDCKSSLLDYAASGERWIFADMTASLKVPCICNVWTLYGYVGSEVLTAVVLRELSSGGQAGPCTLALIRTQNMRPTWRPGFLLLPLLPQPPPHMPATLSLDLSLSQVGSLTNTHLNFFPLFFLNQQNRPFSGHPKLLFLSPIGSLGGRVRAQWFHSVPRASQCELRSTLPFPSCFLYNPKFPASRLLGFPPAFTLVFCKAYSTLKMEAIRSSETSVDFQRTIQCYIPKDSTLSYEYVCLSQGTFGSVTCKPLLQNLLIALYN